MVLGVIPARGGSKGLPRKNILPIAGFPLIYWSIQAAKRSKLLDDYIVSTDDPEIAAIARSYGAHALNRPANLAQDDTTTLAVLQHVISCKPCDSIVVLQPTSPLRNADTIDGCISDFQNGGFDTLATGYYTKIIEYGTHQNLRRQDIPGFFYDDGNVYIINSSVIQSNRWFGDRVCKKTLDAELNVEIDDEVTFISAEALLLKRLQSGRQGSDFHDRLANIKVLAMDVDGVLTDGGMYLSANGDESKKFNARDGMGIARVKKAGIATAFITSENTEIVNRRAEKLSIDHVFMGAIDKLAVLDKIVKKERCSPDEVAYIGDDLNDFDVMRKVGIAVTVPDADEAIKKIAHYVTKHPGGDGAVRELCDLIVMKRNQ
jgi:YrbI family 3-deoxy-D-manno-octulosonate 8-phosphate phosphatase